MSHGLRLAPVGVVLAMALVGAGPDNAGSQSLVTDGRFGSRISPILLIDRVDVQKDLRLNARQISDARTTIATLSKQVMNLKGQKGRTAEDARGRIDEESIRWIRDNLSEKQIERLTQVTFQWEGAAAMTRPHVIARLELTEPQRKAIDQVLQTAREQSRRKLEPAEVLNVSSKAFEVLSPSQKTAWKVLLGPPCHFIIGGRNLTANPVAGYQDLKSPVRTDG